MASASIVKKTITAVEEAKDEVLEALEEQKTETIEEVKTKFEEILSGATERPEHMTNQEWRNHNLSIARAATNRANIAKQQIDAAKQAQWWIKKYPDEAERDVQLAKKRKLAEEFQEQKANEMQKDAVAKAKAKAAVRKELKQASGLAPETPDSD